MNKLEETYDKLKLISENQNKQIEQLRLLIKKLIDYTNNGF